MMKSLTLGELAKLDDGRIDAAFKMELKKLVEDMSDRPGDKTARKIKITLSLTPYAPEGQIEDVKVECDLVSTLPKLRSKAYSMGVHGGGNLVYNDASTEQVNQRTLDELRNPIPDPLAVAPPSNYRPAKPETINKDTGEVTGG